MRKRIGELVIGGEPKEVIFSLDRDVWNLPPGTHVFYVMEKETLTEEVARWAKKNFGTQEPWEPLLGAGEELGELYHSYLKMYQGIRGSKENHIAGMKDAVGDVMIYLANFCGLMGWDLGSIARETWAEVRQRDWVKNQANGAVACDVDGC